MARWKVRPGCRFGVRNQYGPGDLVDLTMNEAAGFADKLEPVPAQDEIADKELAATQPDAPADKPKTRQRAPDQAEPGAA